MSGHNIITIDGDKYILTVPDRYTLEALEAIPDSELEQLPRFGDQCACRSYVGAFCDYNGTGLYFPVYNDEEGLAVCLRHNYDDQEGVFSVNCPNSLVDFRPMLVPVMDDEASFDPCLECNPNGSIIRGGQIYKAGFDALGFRKWVPDPLFQVPSKRPLPTMEEEPCTIGDTVDTDRALEWICVDGKLISRWVLFHAAQTTLYNLGLWFTNREGLAVG